MRCLLPPLRKFNFSSKFLFDHYSIFINFFALSSSDSCFSSSIGAHFPYAANYFAEKELSAYDIISLFLEGNWGLKKFRGSRAGTWRCSILFAAWVSPIELQGSKDQVDCTTTCIILFLSLNDDRGLARRRAYLIFS